MYQALNASEFGGLNKSETKFSYNPPRTTWSETLSTAINNERVVMKLRTRIPTAIYGETTEMDDEKFRNSFFCNFYLHAHKMFEWLMALHWLMLLRVPKVMSHSEELLDAVQPLSIIVYFVLLICMSWPYYAAPPTPVTPIRDYPEQLLNTK